MGGPGKLLKFILLIFAGFITIDILYKITGSLFLTLIVGMVLFTLYARFKARS